MNEIFLDEFQQMGTDIEFNPIDSNPENEVNGIAFTREELVRLTSTIKKYTELAKLVVKMYEVRTR